ncbi:MAG: DUF6359 domain-containing protein [Paludibacteraceae bacterium]
MKKLTFLVAALCATMALNAAEVVDVTLANGKYDTDHITWAEVSDNIVLQQLKGSSSTAVNSSYISAPRVYNGHILAFECAANYSITKIEITYNGTYYGGSASACLLTAATSVSDNTVTDDATKIQRTLSTESNGTHVFSTANAAGESNIYIQCNYESGGKQLRPTAIKITYIKAATTEPVITCGNVEFDIYTEKFGEAQNIEVIGENLSEAIVATLQEGTNFEVSGTLTAAGGTLNVSVKATTEGDYKDVLVLTSGTTTKEVAIHAEVVVLNGDGTEANPFTCADVQKLKNSLGTAEEYWVKGYILGGAASAGSELVVDNTKNSAICLADDKNAETPQIPVALESSSSAREALNAVDNPTVIGSLVRVKGTLEPYFSMPGVKGVGAQADYVIIQSPTTALETVEMSNIYANNGRIYGAEQGRIYTINGMDVTEQNGQLSNGIYIVKVGATATKIAVK